MKFIFCVWIIGAVISILPFMVRLFRKPATKSDMPPAIVEPGTKITYCFYDQGDEGMTEIKVRAYSIPEAYKLCKQIINVVGHIRYEEVN